jgi:hypothetical protein
MKTAQIFALAALAAFAAGCSSSSSDPSPGPQDLGAAGDNTDMSAAAQQASDKNPDGVPYPTDNIGTNARSGSHPGNRIANYKFMAYKDGDLSNGFKAASMADFFDPTGNRHKLIHLQASGSWCTYCQAETKTVAPLRPQLDTRKVVWIITLSEGKVPGTPSTQGDLDKWISTYKAPYTHFLDPGNRNLGPFYDAASLPWNADIDARTMEILQQGTGAATSADDILNDVDGWLAKINNGDIK